MTLLDTQACLWFVWDDPQLCLFDRSLIDQALIENIPIVSVDTGDPAGVSRLW